MSRTQNSGQARSPRIDVKINDRISELEKICADAKEKERNPKMVGYTIFPGETLRVNFIYSFADKELLGQVSGKQHEFILPIVLDAWIISSPLANPRITRVGLSTISTLYRPQRMASAS